MGRLTRVATIQRGCHEIVVLSDKNLQVKGCCCLRFLTVASMEQVIWVFLLPAILYLLILISSHAHTIDPHHRLVFGRQIDV
ncbi:hypothetical protein NC652_030347 [Populus alba x Populus x berolinensis]|nr:hypothetical protein NC652_030347 [Populus alba x Populus x berolinensis]